MKFVEHFQAGRDCLGRGTICLLSDVEMSALLQAIWANELTLTAVHIDRGHPQLDVARIGAHILESFNFTTFCSDGDGKMVQVQGYVPGCVMAKGPPHDAPFTFPFSALRAVQRFVGPFQGTFWRASHPRTESTFHGYSIERLREYPLPEAIQEFSRA